MNAGRDDRALEHALRLLGRAADDGAVDGAHAGEPILALLRNGDHGDDLADAIAHVARCAECRARLVAGEVASRNLVVLAIEAPHASLPSIVHAAEASQARLVERGRGRFTAVVDADHADKLKSDLVTGQKGEASVVTRLVASAPVKVPRDDLTVAARRPMPSMIDIVPKDTGTDAAEVQAWAQMRRVPKQKVPGASPVWALFAVVAVVGAIAIAYLLAIR